MKTTLFSINIVQSEITEIKYNKSKPLECYRADKLLPLKLYMSNMEYLLEL